MRLGFRGLFYLLRGCEASTEWPEDLSPDGEFCGQAVELSAWLSRSESRRPASSALTGLFQTLRSRQRGEQGFFTAELVGFLSDAQIFHECSVSPQHVTRMIRAGFEIEIQGGPRVSPFINAVGSSLLVPQEFQASLLSAGWQGLTLVPCEVVSSQTRFEPPVLWQLSGMGRHFLWPREIVGGPNACGACGTGPVICEECGEMEFQCPECGAPTIHFANAPESANDRRIIAPLVTGDDQGCQTDAAKWDGSDFVNYGDEVIVTRRVIDWLQQQGVGPWMAESVKCELATVRPEQRAALLTAAGSHRSQLERALASLPRNPG